MDNTATETKPADPAEDITALEDAPRSEREDAAERAAQCASEIDAALRRHRCRIIPQLDPANVEPVGVAGNKVQLTATYGIFPLA